MSEVTRREKVLSEPTVAPGAVKYQVLSAAAASVGSIIGIPFLVIVLPFSAWYWPRYYRHLRVVLTTRELKVSRGILNREEKSIPLEKITDLAIYQGPIMRWLGLKGIKVETAGQSGAGAALVKIVGLEGVDAFRDQVLSQRDRITDRDEDPRAAVPPVPSAPHPGATASASEPTGGDRALLEVATEIRDTLREIQSLLKPSSGG